MRLSNSFALNPVQNTAHYDCAVYNMRVAHQVWKKTPRILCIKPNVTVGRVENIRTNKPVCRAVYCITIIQLFPRRDCVCTCLCTTVSLKSIKNFWFGERGGNRQTRVEVLENCTPLCQTINGSEKTVVFFTSSCDKSIRF